MAIIHPYSDSSKFASGGIWEPTATNFPALKHLWKCNEDTAATTLTDSVGGLVVSGSTSINLTNNSDGTVSLAAVANTLSGTWSSPGTKKVLMLTIGKPSATSSNIVCGSVTASTNRGFRCGGVAISKPIISGETDILTTSTSAQTVGDGSTRMIYGLAINWGTKMQPFDYNGTTFVTTDTTGTETTATGITTMDQSISFATSSRPALIAVFHFTTLPSESFIKSAMIWMHSYSTSLTNKWIYPGFRGMT